MYFVGIDVGTGSVRAALVSHAGEIFAQASRPIHTWTYEEDSRLYEQSSAQIWHALAECVRTLVEQSRVRPEEVHGIGFDATCSLVAVQKVTGQPHCITPQHLTQNSERNVILWADHRAEDEARLINAVHHKVLDYVGGTMSLEMEMPKILWLQRHWPARTFQDTEFFDLPDYLTFRATDSRARSNCSLVCKCGYIPPGTAGSNIGWQPDFLARIGLDSLGPGYEALGGIPGRGGLVLTAGMPVGAGLSERAASELGLLPHTPVASAVIDAYAGWVGTAAAPSLEQEARFTSLRDAQTRLVAIAGTSTCYCIQSEAGVHVPGVWGPYQHAVFPHRWMNEGGQSSTGQLIDTVLQTHPAYATALAEATSRNLSVFTLLEEALDAQMEAAGMQRTSPSSYALLVRHMHMYPDFHGNRSPLADSTLRGMLSGLDLDRSRADLARKYVLTLEAIALQTRHIVDEMNRSGHRIEAMYLSGGGQARNLIYAHLLADVCGLRIQVPTEASASVTVGSAILGQLAAHVTQEQTRAPRTAQPVLSSQTDAVACAEAQAERLWHMMAASTKPGHSIQPTTDVKLRRLFDVKYRIFLECIDTQRRWRAEVDAALA